MFDGTITAEKIIDTDFGEKIALDSPYESRHILKHGLPWKEYADEVSEYGSLKSKAEARGTNTKTSELMPVFEAVEEYGFSDDLATHISWEPEALGPDTGAWTVDIESWDEVRDFFEFAGFDVEENI